MSRRSISEKSFKSYTNCFCRLTGALCYAIIIVGSTENVDRHIWGCSQAGKAPDFDSGMRRFESCHPCHDDKSILIRTRKNEKTGDFERFLPFFRPCIFSKKYRSILRFFPTARIRTRENGIFKKSETELNSRKDLNPRHGSNLFGFFVVFTECLQIVDYKINPSGLGEDLNPRCAQKQKLQNNSISPPVGFEPTKVLNLIVISLFSGLSGIGVVLCVVTGGDENEKDYR